MTTDDRTLEAAMAGLATHAPSTLAPDVLVEIGPRRPVRADRLPDRVAGRRVERPRGLRGGCGGRRCDVRGDPLGPDGAAHLPGVRLAGPARGRRSAGGSTVTAGSAIDLDLRGHTDFERDVWAKALEIPTGEVRPYGWIAGEIGRPKAVRAVGTALGHNPVPLIVPCHRVVRSDGTIGQYSLGGPANKRTILRAEGLDPDGLEDAGSGRDPVRRLGYDPRRVPADVPSRQADHRAAPGAVPVLRRRAGRRLPGLPVLQAGVGHEPRRGLSGSVPWPST